MLLLAGCGGAQQTARELDRRLQARLATDIAANHVTVTPLADGAQVTFLDQPSYIGSPDLDPRDTYLLSSVVEGLMDPTLMRIAVADTTPVPVGAYPSRAANATRFLQSYGLGPSLVQPAVVGTPPPGLTLTISVDCPPSGSATRAYGTPIPSCG